MAEDFINLPVRYSQDLKMIFETSDSEAPIARIEAPWATFEERDKIGQQIVAALNEADALRAEVERLEDALRGIRDTDAQIHTLQNMAGVALGKADVEGDIVPRTISIKHHPLW